MNFDIVIIGAGSGNMIADKRFDHLSVAIVEEARFGGTCLNAGCIPSKMFAYTAEVVDTVHGADNFDVPVSDPPNAQWAQVRSRIFDRLDEDSRGAKEGREQTPNITVLTGTAKFVAAKTLEIRSDEGSTSTITGDRIVVAAGSRPVVPEPVSGDDIAARTSDSIMRIDAAPARLAILGGGYIGVEFAHIFAAFGTDVTVIEPADTLLGGHDSTITDAFTEIASHRYTVRLGASVSHARRREGEILLELDDGTTVTTDLVLAATGRRPNSDRLDCTTAGIELDEKGHIVTDDRQRTNVDGIYALGDICASIPLKHVANREAQVVADNLLDDRQPSRIDTRLVPSAVFTSPQIASIGETEEQLKDRNANYRVAVKKYADVAYGWALQDESGLCKILADADSGKILGAHILGPQASTLIHILSVAMQFDIGASELATDPYWAHPALPELIENTLLALDKP